MPPVASVNPANNKTTTAANAKLADNKLKIPAQPAKLARSGATNLSDVVKQFESSRGNTDSNEDIKGFTSGIDT